MKKLLLSVFAVAFVITAASTAQSSMVYHDLAAIDSAGLAVVSISTPSSPIVVSQTDKLVLDSNGLWAASDYSKVSKGSGMMTATGMSKASHEKLYCFDFANKFCAVAY